MFLALFLPLQLLTAAAPDERVFGLDSQTVIHIIAQAINISLLMVLMVYLLYKPVQNFMRKRSEKIGAQIEQAQVDMNAANTLRSQYKQSMENIEQERVEILEGAHRVSEDKRRKILAEGKEQAEQICAQARLDIEREQEKAKEALKDHVVEISSIMANKIVAHVMDKETQDRLFQEALTELEASTWPR